MKSAVLFAALTACASAQQHPIIPGAEIIQRGFDMVKGTQNASTPGVTLLNIWGWDYTQGKTYTNPFDPTVTYSIPDQMEMTPIDSSAQTINEALVQSFSMWINTVSSAFHVSAGISVGNGTSAFSMNAAYNRETYKYEMEMSDKLAASGYSRHWWSLYQLEGLPPFLMKFDPAFTAGIERLPLSIKSAADQTKYNQVVEYWGTHYAVLANFGGEVDLSTFVNQSIFAHHSESWVRQQFALEFHFWLFNISAGGFSNRSQIHINEAFKEASSTFMFFKGGDLALQTNATIPQWIASIPKEPIYLNVTIADVSTAISDSYPTRAVHLRNTIAAYIKTGKYPAADGSIKDYDEYYRQFTPEVAPELYTPTGSVGSPKNLRG